MRLGLDGLIGLLPATGDVSSGAIGAYIVYEAYKQKLPPVVISEILGNLAKDATLVSIPIVGDFLISDHYCPVKKNDRSLKSLSDLKIR